MPGVRAVPALVVPQVWAAWQASDSQRISSSGAMSAAAESAHGARRAGIPAAYPSVNSTARPSRSRSGARRAAVRGRRAERGPGHLRHAAAPARRPANMRRRQRVQVGLAGQPGIERLELPGRRRAASSRRRRRGLEAIRDLAAQQVRPGRAGAHPAGPASALASRSSAAPGAPAWCLGLARPPAPGRPGAPDRGSAPPPAPGTRPPPRSRRVAAPGPPTAQARRRVLVGPRGGLGAVPGAPIRIELRIGHLRQRAVRLPAFARRRRPVDGRAHQRMPEPHPAPISS